MGVAGYSFSLVIRSTLAFPNSQWALRGIGHTKEEKKFLRWAHAGRSNNRDGWHLSRTTTGLPSEMKTFTASIGNSARYALIGGRVPPLKEVLTQYDPQVALYAIRYV
jgi:hypothetical protein